MQTVKQYKIISVRNKEKLLSQIIRFAKDGWKCDQVWCVSGWFSSRYEALVTKELFTKLEMNVGPVSIRS
jgi:hypothetical protein